MTGFPRFGYVGGGNYPLKYVSDRVTSEVAGNALLKDNFTAHHTDTSQRMCLAGLISAKKPGGSLKRFQGYLGDVYLQHFSPGQLPCKIASYIIEFNKPDGAVDELFMEAEDGALGGTASVDNSLGDDSGDSVKLVAQWDYVHEWKSSVLSVLSKGRYLFAARIKDLNQVTDDVRISVWNNDDSKFLNEENDWVYFTATGSFLWYGVIFDLTSLEDGDAVYFRVQKTTTNTNSVWVDVFAYFPLSDGMNMPLDLAHNFLRFNGQKFKIVPK